MRKLAAERRFGKPAEDLEARTAGQTDRLQAVDLDLRRKSTVGAKEKDVVALVCSDCLAASSEARKLKDTSEYS